MSRRAVVRKHRALDHSLSFLLLVSGKVHSGYWRERVLSGSKIGKSKPKTLALNVSFDHQRNAA